MRGKDCRSADNVQRVRITPAYAGKSLYHRAKCSSDRDHPRLCGEKALTINASGAIVGSPPPMRGKAAYIITSALQIGITLAYAGKSLPVCVVIVSVSGSPPPMRGKEYAQDVVDGKIRITPAYAGKRYTP